MHTLFTVGFNRRKHTTVLIIRHTSLTAVYTGTFPSLIKTQASKLMTFSFGLQGYFDMVPLNLTCLHCLQHFFFENFFNLYYMKGNNYSYRLLLPKFFFCLCYDGFLSIIHCHTKLMKGKALRKHILHEKTEASVLLRLFISSNE